jgi:hypothetical protein
MFSLLTGGSAMSSSENAPKFNSKVFISYSSQDKAAADKLREGLLSRHLNVELDPYEIKAGSQWEESIRTTISASSYIVLLLSRHSLSSHWVAYETERVLDELRRRAITILPILLEDCELPPSLATVLLFDMRSGIEENIERLVHALQSTPSINFGVMSPQAFERLARDLLEKLGFESIHSQSRQKDWGADFVAEYRYKDPFGAETKDFYVIETKLYRDSRADLRALNQLVNYAKRDPKINKALLITNSRPTSVALDWVKEIQKTTTVSVRVIDGTELKRLLLQYPDLVSQYFPMGGATS